MKPRKDITLGEMQDECKRVSCDCHLCDMEIRSACKSMESTEHDHMCPDRWNLTDPPRFTEAQMAFWRGWYEIGARWVKRRGGTACVDFSLTTSDFCASYSCVLPNQISNELEEGKAYDLAELLGKDGAE